MVKQKDSLNIDSLIDDSLHLYELSYSLLDIDILLPGVSQYELSIYDLK